MFSSTIGAPLARAVRSGLQGPLGWYLAVSLLVVPGCDNTGKESLARASEHSHALVELAKQDVAEVRSGLPLGAQELAKRWASEGVDLTSDAEAARAALNHARNKVQDLRVAKSTFFALAGLDGRTIRNDREQDLMAGTALFKAFPDLARAVGGGYVEALGVLPEAHGVKGKPDGEWVAAQGIRIGDQVRGLYVTGWAWSSYAYRLEFSLRSKINGELQGARTNVPLLYAFVIVGSDVYSAPESPEVNARSIAERQPLKNITSAGTYAALFDITGRTFALGVELAPDLGEGVALGVLRSET